MESSNLDKHEASETLSEACQAEVAQILGKTFLLYRAAKTPVIILPKTDSPKKTKTV